MWYEGESHRCAAPATSLPARRPRHPCPAYPALLYRFIAVPGVDAWLVESENDGDMGMRGREMSAL
jgi:hypothetical protein